MLFPLTGFVCKTVHVTADFLLSITHTIVVSVQRSSSSSGCLGKTALFYCGTPCVIHSHPISKAIYTLLWTCVLTITRLCKSCNILRILITVKRQFSVENVQCLSYICLKYRLLVLVRTASSILTCTHNLCFRVKVRKNVYPCKPQLYYTKVGCEGV